MKKLFLAIPILLSGCSLHSQDLGCPPGKGVLCKSIDQVNDMVEEGSLPCDGEQNKKVLPPKILATYPISGKNIRRIPEQHLSVYIAGYEDGVGNFHEASYVHTVVQASHWSIGGDKRCSQR